VFVALLAGIPYVAWSGAVVPRLDVTLSGGQVGPDRLAPIFRVRNMGHTDVKIEDFTAAASGLRGMHVETSFPKTVRPGHDLDIEVRYDGFDCAAMTGDFASHHVKIRTHTAIRLAQTRSYKLEFQLLASGFNPTGVARSQIDQQGWVKAITAEACK
jgi:hypothetical protein